jgi:hypothetical protein
MFWKVVYSPDGEKLTSFLHIMGAGLGLHYLPGEIVRPSIGPIYAWSDLSAAAEFVAQIAADARPFYQLWEAEGRLHQGYLGVSYNIALKHLSRESAQKFWSKLDELGNGTEANPDLDAYLKEKSQGLVMTEYFTKALEWIKLTRKLQ